MGHFEVLVILKFRVTLLLERNPLCMQFLTVWLFDRTFSSGTSCFWFFSCRMICWQLHINFNVSLSACKGLTDSWGCFIDVRGLTEKNDRTGLANPLKPDLVRRPNFGLDQKWIDDPWLRSDLNSVIDVSSMSVISVSSSLKIIWFSKELFFVIVRCFCFLTFLAVNTNPWPLPRTEASRRFIFL